VTFGGPVSHDEVMERLTNVDALISASSYEGLPHVVIEALSAGTPVISSAAGGVPEVLGGGTGGVIVDPATPQEFARVLQNLRNDRLRLRELRDGALELGKGWLFATSADEIERLLVECSPEPKPSRRRRPARLRSDARPV
jgi:glycosyltransferase involved in cell wall biosynthesis